MKIDGFLCASLRHFFRVHSLAHHPFEFKMELIFFQPVAVQPTCKMFQSRFNSWFSSLRSVNCYFFFVGHCPDVKYKLYPGAFNLKYTMYHFNKNQVP